MKCMNFANLLESNEYGNIYGKIDAFPVSIEFWLKIFIIEMKDLDMND